MSSTSEEEMATLAADTTPSTQPFKQRRKSCARKVERFCWLGLTYFPLTFVYGLTTWAVWVETTVSFIDGTTTSSYLTAGLGILFYCLANISYTIAVFTPPGSPLDHPSQSTRRGRGGRYESLPTYENEEEAEVPSDMSTVTAKASGKKRYCKKCRVVKPDRTHHCSTCGKCVMKMDHHCPWLATCVGLRNYKAFLLFLVYTCFFCWTCFAVSFRWTWDNIVQEAIVDDGWRLVNTILLAVLGGIIGLVLSGFTSWHIYLTLHGATTIESLEKTRYLNPLRKSVQQQFEHRRNYLSQDGTAQPSFTDRMTEIHANALPGVLRPEEGNIEIPVNTPPQALRPTDSPARDSLQQSYASLEAQREHDRYEAYLDEKDSDKLPNAFDLGWKRNVLHVLGPAPLLWLLPICNTTGDGWRWEVSRKWQAARDDIAKERTRRQQETARWDVHNTNTQQQSGQDVRWMPGQGFVPRVQPPPRNSERDGMSLHTFDAERNGLTGPHNHNAEQSRGTSNWNDIPDDFLDRPDSRSRSSRSQVRAKGD